MIELPWESSLTESKSSSSETKVEGIESFSEVDIKEPLEIVTELSFSKIVSTVRLS